MDGLKCNTVQEFFTHDGIHAAKRVEKSSNRLSLVELGLRRKAQLRQHANQRSVLEVYFLGDHVRQRVIDDAHKHRLIMSYIH